LGYGSLLYSFYMATKTNKLLEIYWRTVTTSWIKQLKMHKTI
jgi:hypothetical protein